MIFINTLFGHIWGLYQMDILYYQSTKEGVNGKRIKLYIKYTSLLRTWIFVTLLKIVKSDI